MQRDEVSTPDETELLQFFHTFMREGTAKATPNQSEPQQHDKDDGGWEKLQEQDGDEESSAGSSMESNTESIPSSSDRSTTDDGETKADTKTESPQLTGTTQRRSTHYQMRQRRELDYLKGKVRELERTLCRLENDSGGSTGMWQRVAQQQQRASNQAVAENAQLRTMVAAQLKFSQALEKVLRKRPLFDGGEQPDTRGLPRRKTLTAESLCRELKARVIHEHGLFEHVLDKSGVAAISTDHHSYDIKVRADPHVPGRTQLRVEWVSVRRMPFAFSAVSREIWGFLCDSSQLDKVSGIARKVETAAEELFTTTTFAFPVGERSASLHQYGAVRRTVSSEWDGFNWVTQGDCYPRRGAKEFFQISEKGW